MIKVHMFRRFRRASVVVCCAALVSLGALPANAEASSPPPLSTESPGFYFAPAPGGGVTPMASSGPITAGSCTYTQEVDNPHITGEASVHGYWKVVSGTCPSKANVEVWLQAYGCDPFVCGWVTVAHGEGDYYAGGGSGKRANARRTCATTATTGWRGYVDVDLIGASDPSGYTYGPGVNLACRP